MSDVHLQVSTFKPQKIEHPLIKLIN